MKLCKLFCRHAKTKTGKEILRAQIAGGKGAMNAIQKTLKIWKEGLNCCKECAMVYSKEAYVLSIRTFEVYQ